MGCTLSSSKASPDDPPGAAGSSGGIVEGKSAAAYDRDAVFTSLSGVKVNLLKAYAEEYIEQKGKRGPDDAFTKEARKLVEGELANLHQAQIRLAAHLPALLAAGDDDDRASNLVKMAMNENDGAEQYKRELKVSCPELDCS